MQEIWKPVNIPKYKDYFIVSNFGNVKRIKKLHRNSLNPIPCNYFLKTTPNKKGYLMVALSLKGKAKLMPIHRLVALTFIENQNPCKNVQVNHIDGNKSNNCSNNLEWCTAKENVQHALKTGLFHRNQETRPVYQFSLDGTFVKKWSSGMEASRFLNVKEDTIYSCCNNKRSSTRGYLWSYSENLCSRPLKIQRHHKNGVIQYDLKMNKINEFSTIKEAALKTGANKSRISLCCSHKVNQAGGYKWEYK